MVSQHTAYARECQSVAVFGAAMLGRHLSQTELKRIRYNAYSRSWGKQVSPEARQLKNDKARGPARERYYRVRQDPQMRKVYALRHRLKRYELDEQGYYALYEKQGGLCAICLQPERQLYKGKPVELSIDHDHKTGKVRGLLCSACNSVIGFVEDDPSRLQAAVEYLKNLS